MITLLHAILIVISIRTRGCSSLNRAELRPLWHLLEESSEIILSSFVMWTGTNLFKKHKKRDILIKWEVVQCQYLLSFLSWEVESDNDWGRWHGWTDLSCIPNLNIWGDELCCGGDWEGYAGYSF